MTGTHTEECLYRARACVLDNCGDILTAPSWDMEALEVENLWIMNVALTWLEDGTKDCTCAELTA